jgi:hypothetical protein
MLDMAWCLGNIVTEATQPVHTVIQKTVLDENEETFDKDVETIYSLLRYRSILFDGHTVFLHTFPGIYPRRNISVTEQFNGVLEEQWSFCFEISTCVRRRTVKETMFKSLGNACF